MNNVELRQKLHHYIENAEEKKLKAIFAMVEDEILETYNHWDNQEFLNELQRREEAYLNGIAKTYTFEESSSRARAAISKALK